MKLCLPFSVLKTMRCTSRGRRRNSEGCVGWTCDAASRWTRDCLPGRTAAKTQWGCAVKIRRLWPTRRRPKPKCRQGHPPALATSADLRGVSSPSQLRVRKAGDQKKQPAYHQVDDLAPVFSSSAGWPLKQMHLNFRKC